MADNSGMTIAADSPDASLADVLDRAVAGHPAPSAIAPELIAEAQQEFSTPAHQATTAARVYPSGFDPALHVYPPEKTARGTWRKLRRGQANNLDALNPSPSEFDDAAAESQPGESPAQAAENVCATFFAIAPALLGGEWEPTTEERAAVQTALTRYYAANGSIDLPPGLALILAVGTYALPRAMAMPAVQRLYTKAAAKMFGGAQATADDAAPVAHDGPLFPTTPADPHEPAETIASMYHNDNLVRDAA